MAFSLYDVSIPVMIRGLGIMSQYLEQASAFAAENNISPTVLVEARLAPDMLPLAGQVQRASDNAKGAIARLTGREMPSFPDNETTFADLQERIKKTVSLLEAVDPDEFKDSEDRHVEMRFGGVDNVLRRDTYTLTFLLPSFFFHVTTMHNILRHNGLKIGKEDYIGALTRVEA
jgi:hypothetical protein